MSASVSRAVSREPSTSDHQDGGIGLWPCVAFAVGTMVGAGVFVLSGLAVEQAGPAALASFVLAAVLVLLSALSFTVVASRAGHLAGGISTYNEASVGQAAKHLIGSWGGVLVPIGALVCTLSAANANILGASELMVRLAAKKDDPTMLGRM